MRRILLISAVVLLLLYSSVIVFADEGGIPHWMVRTGDFEIGVGSELGSASFVPDDSLWVGEDITDPETGLQTTIYTYTVTEPIELVDSTNGNTIGWIDSMVMTVDQDPALGLSFSCRSAGAVTTFTYNNYMTTSLVSPKAKATASVTATDLNGDGATIAGLFGTNLVYQASYNSGTLFSNLVSGGSCLEYESYSPGPQSYGWIYGLPGVTRMDAKYSFTLSAYDSASGTSNFVMLDPIPEPSSLLALASGLVPLGVLIRRRR